MSRDTWARTAWISRALVAMTSVATLVATGSATLAAEPSPSPSTTVAAAAGMCPVGHVVATARAAPDATPVTDAQDTPAASPQSQAPPSPPPKEPPPRPLTDLGGTWRELPRSPLSSLNAIAVWAGDRMVAFDPRRGRTATYYPPTHRWEEHQPMPGKNRANGETISGPPLTAWTGTEVVVLGYRDAPESIISLGYAFDPARGRWREIAPPPIDDAREAAWTGDLLVVTTRNREAAAYDPVADCWLRMPDVALPEIAEDDRDWRAKTWTVDSIHAAGDEVLAVVRTGSRVPLGVVSFDPDTWAWEPGPQAPPSSSLSRPVLADGRLWFLFEKPVADRIVNATYDPATERWQALDESCPLSSDGAVWTGRLIMEPRWDRHAYDPVTGECFRTPRGKDRARTSAAEVWTGRELITWSGAYGDAARAFPDGLVYRPPRMAVTAEKAKPIGKKLERAISARRRWGFDTDPAVVREIMRDRYQPGSYAHGFPMTEAEQRDLYSRSSFAGRASDIKGWLRKLPTFGGIWQDQRAGGAIAIALTEADPEVLRGIDQHLAPYDTPTPWRLVVVPRTERDLKQALWRVGAVSKRIDPDAMLWAAGVDLSAGRLSLMYDPDDVGHMRARKKELEKRLGVPVRITSGRVRDT